MHRKALLRTLSGRRRAVTLPALHLRASRGEAPLARAQCSGRGAFLGGGVFWAPGGHRRRAQLRDRAAGRPAAGKGRGLSSLLLPSPPRPSSPPPGPAPSGRFCSAPLGPGNRPRADLAASEPAASAARVGVTAAPSPPLSPGGTARVTAGCAGPAPCPRSGSAPGGLRRPGTCARCRAQSVPGDSWSVLAARQVSLGVWLERTKLRSFFPCRDGVELSPALLRPRLGSAGD